jgi:phage FluMu gp28-like protein
VQAWLDDQLAPLLARLDPATPHALGQDFARKLDLSVLWVLSIEPGLQRRTPFVIELRNMPFAQQQQVLRFVCDRLPRLRAIALDAGGNGMAHAEAAADRYGSSVLQVMMTEPWYRAHMPPLRAALEDDMLTLPRDRDIETDFRMVKLVRGVPRVVEHTRDEAGQRHGDSAIAAALAWHASEAETMEYGYRPVPREPGGGAALRSSGGSAADGGASPSARDEARDDRMNQGRIRRERAL